MEVMVVITSWGIKSLLDFKVLKIKICSYGALMQYPLTLVETHQCLVMYQLYHCILIAKTAKYQH